MWSVTPISEIKSKEVFENISGTMFFTDSNTIFVD